MNFERGERFLCTTKDWGNKDERLREAFIEKSGFMWQIELTQNE
jgi:hypothetical protein